ncbi:DUF4112 domain-containing protein [Alkalilimnicola sp. S0819]|uniref:DUF4112 domain-containing protein n=1 Tax=Alkalilimnicola sp. S0819 TaxID=2613922 RepID=UPI001261DF6B|nr:DUF4112 domain-containing protein [Alkalilimnicola sp. S0819]KAB7627464.1 DUF4112 domain-containing protein [Alkalilimnicola sp. S0819]MPQ15613.1 DUF4112 domain-containing protein [Alkalilimnicola sp. S0819]
MGTEAQLRELDRLARLLDSSLRVPGTRWRFGLDGLIGLIPGAGDLATGGLSAWIVLRAWRMGAPRTVLLRMAANVGLDVLLGSVPLLGDAFDFFFKANRRNLRLLRRHLQRHGG